jgi:hypothetical protein
MKRFISIIAVLALVIMFLPGCLKDSQETKTAKMVSQQQAQYEKAQPVPAYNFSIERDLLRKLYDIRNQKVATHSVWRSDYGMIEGDCPSMGFGLPYDTSMTNPLKIAWRSSQGGAGVVEQAEPNGIYASKNTNATWVMCVNAAGIIEPHYVESKVTAYPGPVRVDYTTNRVYREGDATVTMVK